jgi:hypothetical protein
MVTNINFLWGMAIGAMSSLTLLAIFFPNKNNKQNENDL